MPLWTGKSLDYCFQRYRRSTLLGRLFEDAPVGEKERAEVINRMLRIQLDMIKERTGNPNPFVRVTFYDELSDLLAKGYLRPPVGDNIFVDFLLLPAVTIILMMTLYLLILQLGLN